MGAWSRPDIPLHALAAYKMPREGLEPEEPGVKGPMAQIEEVKSKGYPVAFVGDVLEPARHASRQLTLYCGSLVKTYRVCLINEAAVCALVQKSRLSSLTPWKMPVHWCLKPMWKK